ncbi:helix-turn-helix domain-containing protein [Streptomyces sp. NPDC001903]|uniref:helix-turn-helix domain-containing protein n=1 Tax=Streptomyces sp. NPDC001903 TaxID=3364622 RepID=UPI0036A95712
MTESVEEPRLPSPKERRRLREAAGLTYEAVATAVGVRANTVRSWESGRTHPRGSKLDAYAALLGSLAAPAPAAGPTGTDAAAPDAAAPEAAAPDAAPPDAAAPARADSTADPGDAPSDPGAEADARGEAAVWMLGALRPFGMSGHGRPAPPPPVAVPRHEAGFTVRAAARAIGTPGPGTSWPTAPAEARARAGDGHASAPAGGQAPTGATTSGAGGHQGHPVGPEGGPAPGGAAGQVPAEGAAGEVGGAEPESGEAGGQAAAAAPAPAPGPGAVFDALYQYSAPALARQAYLLTGRRRLAEEAVERAFQQAWARWPEVAADPDPVGWVRAAAYEYALSPWHAFRRAHKHPDKAPAAPADRILMDAMLALPPAHRRTVLLYDGVGLDLPDTAAETEASTPTAGNRLLHAHGALADRIPELAAAPPEKQSAVLRERLGAVTPAVPLEPRPAVTVRMAAEYRATRWTRVFLGLTAVIAVATAYTTATAPRQYEPPIAPGASVSGVPPLAGPQRLTDETRQLREKLRSHPAHRPERIAPSLE